MTTQNVDWEFVRKKLVECQIESQIAQHHFLKALDNLYEMRSMMTEDESYN